MGVRAWKSKTGINGDVLYSAEIDVESAKNGGTFEVHLEDGTITLNLKPGKVVQGTRIRVAGRGQRPVIGGAIGDLYLEFAVREEKVTAGYSPVTVAIVGVLVTIAVLIAMQVHVRWIKDGCWGDRDYSDRTADLYFPAQVAAS
jgi:hypothetical protein